MHHTRSSIAGLLAALALAASGLPPSPVRAADPAASGEPPPLVVFLVRHAEKLDASEDPPLTDAGAARAALLADLLRDARLQQVHSTDTRRTRDTAAPVAARVGVDVSLYDPRDLPGLVDALRARGGRHLVVGHSNTTPRVVELLGGDPGTPIEEGGEYDRLYVVTAGPDGRVTTLLLRYGAPPPT